jgi:hypothetical protein
MSKVRYDEWYFDDNCERFIKEIEFVYDTYVKSIKNIYNTPDCEADRYVSYLEQNFDELESLNCDDAMLEIQSRGQERYYFVLNMKYRNLAIYINLIYQMLEQFIISLCKFQQKYHSYNVYINRLRLRDLHKCNLMFKKYDFDFENLKEYNKIYELRLLQNVLKHSDGESKEELLTIRPDYFIEKNSVLAIYKNTIIDATLNISDDDLKEYVIAIKEFLR